MANVSYQIANLLEKMTSSDKDFRFMATNDLMSELQKDSIKLDDDSERKVVRMLLKLLEDKNGEVQNLAVKCLGPLVNKVKEYQVETIVDSLCNNMVSDKEQLRDISSIGLKTVISELPLASTGLAANVCKRITGKLSAAIEKQEDVSVQLEALDILADLLSRFGGLLVSFHPLILNALLPQLSSPRQAVRKRKFNAHMCANIHLSNTYLITSLVHDIYIQFLQRFSSGADNSIWAPQCKILTCNATTFVIIVYNLAFEHTLKMCEIIETIVALSHLVMSCSQSLYKKLIEVLLDGLTSDSGPSTVRTYIQCIAALCRQAGHRFGEHLDRVMNLIVRYSSREDDELREFCLQATQAFVHKCPKEITPHINTVREMCLQYLTYDPNYNYDEEENSGTSMDLDEEESEDGDEDYSDDDDMSWKVRRASAKCLEAIIATRPEYVPELYRAVSPALIARFKEREENVKSDIFHAYITLLKQTRSSTVSSLDPNCMEDEDAPLCLLQKQVPHLVKAIQGQMKERSIKTRQDCFALLKELVSVLPGALTNHMESLIPGIQYSLGDRNSSSNMKIDTLSFLHTLLCTHPAEVFHAHMNVLVPPVVAAVSDSFYKITAEALLVLQQLVKVLRPLDSPSNFNFAPFTSEMYECTLTRLRAADLDQEVKERAISCMGQIICSLGDYLQGELPTCLPIFLDRLRNEITRLTTVKALTKVAASPLRIDLRPILADGVPILATFLRKNQRALKLSTLTLLDTLVNNYSPALSFSLLEKVKVELPPLLSESDLHIAQLTLVLLTSIAKLQPQSLVDLSRPFILPEILTLAKSPLLQGGALSSLLEFLEALARADLPHLGNKELLEMLTRPVSQHQPPLHKQAFHSLAKCVAAVTVPWENEALIVIDKLLRDVQTPVSDQQHIFALLVIGEIGRHIDLDRVSNLKETILASFLPQSEEVKSAASYTLGSVAVGNLQAYLPFVLQEIEAQPRRQYLLLHSLKEIISCQSGSSRGVTELAGYVPLVWELLLRHAECPEEGTRNVVSECLGKLTLLEPHQLLPRLRSGLTSPSPLMRATVLTALKFTISDQPQAIDPLLRLSIGQFLEALEDPDLNVRRVALVAFNSAAHNKPSLVRDLLDSVLPKLYLETNVRKELIREVEMGPFKHIVDDGLDLRKAAFECMYTLLDSCLDRLDIFEFLNHLEHGLKDHYDIKMLTYLMVARLAQLAPSPVLQRLEGLVEPLKNTCTMKVKANSVKQEYEKQDELKRSAMRAVAALLTIPDADKNPHLSEFVSQIKSTTELQTIFDSIQKDSSLLNQDANMMDLS